MRITLVSDTDSIPFSNGPEQDLQDWWIESEGLKGLYGSPAPREKGISIPQADGEYWPSRLTQGGRDITMKCSTASRSSVENRDRIRRLCDLMVKELTIIVDDEAGRTYLTGYIADDIDATVFFSRDRLWFTLLIHCPDPNRYGTWVESPSDNGIIRVENTGDAASWPKIVANGCTSISLSLGAHSVRWSGSKSPMSLDFADMNPSQGVVVVDDAFQIPPGTSTIPISADGDVTMLVRPAWR